LTKGFDVFLSYNSLDREAVENVAKSLREKPFSLNPFLDRWHLAPGQNWVQALESQLSQSRAVIVFIGPHDFGSWQQRERDAALDRHGKTRGLAF